MRAMGCLFGFMGGGVVGAVLFCAIAFAVLRMDGMSRFDGPTAIYAGGVGLVVGGIIAAVWAVKMFKP